MTVAQVLTYSIRLVSTLVLTRLLAPDLFGLVSIVWTVTTIVGVLSDVGLTPIVIQNERGAEKEFLDTIWIIQIGRGFVIWGVVVLFALSLYPIQRLGWLAPDSSFAHAELPMVLMVAGVISVINGFASSKVCLANRNLNVASVLFIEAGGQAIALIVSATLASAWHSVWALVIASIVSALVQAAATHRFLPGPSNSFRWDSRTAQAVAKFGRSIMASSAISVLASNGDRLILGIVAVPTEVGWYAVAFTLANVGASFIGRIVNAVTLPALSETLRRSEADFKAAYEKLRLVSDGAMLAIGGLLATLGKDLVHILYDDRYRSAGSVLQIMGLGLLVSRYAIFQQVYISLGRPSRLIWINLASLIALLVATPLAYRSHGIEGAALAISFRDAAALPLIAWFNARDKLNRWGLELKLLGIFLVAMLVGALISHLLSMIWASN